MFLRVCFLFFFPLCKPTDQLLETEIDNVNTGNVHGESALHFAAAFGHEHCVDWLLENGAVVDRRSAGGATPLHMAATQVRLDWTGSPRTIVIWLKWKEPKLNNALLSACLFVFCFL